MTTDPEPMDNARSAYECYPDACPGHRKSVTGTDEYQMLPGWIRMHEREGKVHLVTLNRIENEQGEFQCWGVAVYYEPNGDST